MNNSKTVVRKVTLSGIRPIMFDRYSGSNAEELETRDKLNTLEDGTVVLPSINLVSFLSSTTNESATQRVMGKKWRAVAKAALSFIDIDPLDIPILADGKPIKKDDPRIKEVFGVPRMKKGPLVIPNPKTRPVIPLPWEIRFTLTLFDNNDLSESILKKIIEEGGYCLGLGSFRGVYGKFQIKSWE